MITEGLNYFGKALNAFRATEFYHALTYEERDVAIQVFHKGWSAHEQLRPLKRLARHQTCGCVVCSCEDEERCHGCGAKNCGTHPVGEIPNPVYDHPVPQAPKHFTSGNKKKDGLPSVDNAAEASPDSCVDRTVNSQTPFPPLEQRTCEDCDTYCNEREYKPCGFFYRRPSSTTKGE